MTETYSNESAICPCCGYENRPEDSDGYLYDEDTDEWECGECGKAFSVSVYFKRAWSCKEMT